MAIEILPTVAGRMKILSIGQKDGVWQGNLWTKPFTQQEIIYLWSQLAQFLRITINQVATYPVQPQLWDDSNTQLGVKEVENEKGLLFDDYLDDLDLLGQYSGDDGTQPNQDTTIITNESACRFSAAFWPETSTEPPPPLTSEAEEEYWRIIFEERRYRPGPSVGVLKRLRAYRNGNLGTFGIKFFLPPKLRIAISPLENGLHDWLHLLADETSYQHRERRLRFLGRNMGVLLSGHLAEGKIPKAKRKPDKKVPTFSRAVENALWLVKSFSDLDIKNEQEKMKRLAFALAGSGDLARYPHFFLEPARFERNRKPLLSLEECMEVTTRLAYFQESGQDGQPLQLVERDRVWADRLRDLAGCQISKTRIPNIFTLTGPIQKIL